MTAQISDTVHFRGNDFALASFDGDADALFDPREHGMQPESPHTACWRGFVCHYAVVDDRFLLDRLDVCLRGTPALPLFGVTPKPPGGERDYFSEYAGLALPIAISGRLTIARDFIQDRYVHMGFQDASAYRNVWTLTFDRGALTDAKDRSAEMTARRSAKPDEPREDLMGWIQDRFSRKPRE